MRLGKYQQWLYPFLYPFEMLQQYYFKIHFMIMVTTLLTKLLDCEFLVVFKLSPVQCFKYSDVYSDVVWKKWKFKCSLQMYWSLHHEIYVIPQGCYVEKGLCVVTLAGYLKTDSLQQLLSFYSVFLACQKCSTRALAVYVSHICPVFLLFLPLPQNSKKGLVAWQVWWKICYPPAAASAGAKLLLW